MFFLYRKQKQESQSESSWEKKVDGLEQYMFATYLEI